MRAKKKAQMELMGLAIIVVIMVIAMFFAIGFLMSAPKKSVVKSFEDDQLATNFIVALLKTSACDVTVEKLIYDCSLNQVLDCDGGTDNSCAHLETVVEDIKNATLDEWGVVYDLHIDMPSSTDIRHTVPECVGQVEKATQGFQPISLYPAPVQAKVTLDICRI